MSELSAQVRDDFSRGEAIGGIVWLGLGASVSALLEAVYLSAPLYLSVVAALLLNGVLTKTARLWSPRRAVTLSPLAVWALTLGLVVAAPGSVVTFSPQSLETLALGGAGVVGGLWPLRRRQ